jgi:hypothetical protein
MRLYLEQTLSRDELKRLTTHLHPGPADAVDGSATDGARDDRPDGESESESEGEGTDGA